MLDVVDAGLATTSALTELQSRGRRLADVTVFAFGKAALPMAEAACANVRVVQGVVIAPEAELNDDWRRKLAPLQLRPGGHPLPRSDAPEHARAALEFAGTLGSGDVALCLVSGGGSAMLEWPRPGLRLDTLIRDQEFLLNAGVEIRLLNAVRRRLSRVKGGRLAAAMPRSEVSSLILSDVGEGSPSWVASGPTLAPEADPDPRPELLARGLLADLSEATRRLLEQPDEPLRLPERMSHRVIADGRAAAGALATSLSGQGLSVAEWPTPITGEARDVARSLWPGCRALALRESVDAVVFFGETQVRVRGEGRGGRNQELVLAGLEGYDGGRIWSFATDGVDGSSDHAGAFLEPDVVARARALGLHARSYLAANDSHAFFEATGGALRTGPTGTNVADVGCYIRPG